MIFTRKIYVEKHKEILSQIYVRGMTKKNCVSHYFLYFRITNQMDVMYKSNILLLLTRKSNILLGIGRGSRG